VPPGPEREPPAGGSWPPVPPPLVNRLVSSATATPFVPEVKRPAISEIPFSCVVEPPPKRGRTKEAPEAKPSAPARSVVPIVPPAPDRPAVRANPALTNAPVAAGTPATMTTVPPFAQGGTGAPFAAPASATPFEFNPEKPEKVRWLSWSTLLLVAGCVAGYYQYQRMQRAEAEAPPPAAAPATDEKAGAAPPKMASFATPFTALKQARATIKDAGEKHKAAYELVEKMLDDPNAAIDAAPKPAVAPVVVPAAEPESGGKARRDAVEAVLGTDGEFLVPAGSPKPSLRFAHWVRTVRIGGARLNDHPRVLVGAAAYTFGDVVELNLGIVLEGYNAERRALRFKETATGALIERRI